MSEAYQRVIEEIQEYERDDIERLEEAYWKSLEEARDTWGRYVVGEGAIEGAIEPEEDITDFDFGLLTAAVAYEIEDAEDGCDLASSLDRLRRKQEAVENVVTAFLNPTKLEEKN